MLAKGDMINISIKPKDIIKGKQMDCRECPGALAITRKLRKLGALGPNQFVAVSPMATVVMEAVDGGERRTAIADLRHPFTLTRWINHFDCDRSNAVPARFKLVVTWTRPADDA